ncbi:unnamed protein product [Diamesa hyperborea]
MHPNPIALDYVDCPCGFKHSTEDYECVSPPERYNNEEFKSNIWKDEIERAILLKQQEMCNLRIKMSMLKKRARKLLRKMNGRIEE